MTAHLPGSLPDLILLDRDDVKLASRREGVRHSRPTDVFLMTEANRLIELWQEMAPKGGRASIDAAILYKTRVAPLLDNVLRNRWDLDQARWPALYSLVERMTAP